MPFKPNYEVPERRRAYTIYGQNYAQQEGNGRVGCLMLHGFMGSPTSSRPMASFLTEHNITVHCPLLPGHGNLPEKIINYKQKDWIAEAEEGLQTLQKSVDEIFVLGHSMGAILAAYLAQKSDKVKGLILLSPMYEVPDKRIKWVSIIRFFTPYFYPLKRKGIDHKPFIGRVTDFDPSINVHDPSLQEWLVKATRIPVPGVWEMVKTAKMGRRLWPKLTVPCLIFQGEADTAVSPGNARHIYEHLQMQDKALYTFPDAGHHLMRPREPAHEQVWQHALRFIQENSSIQMATSN